MNKLTKLLSVFVIAGAVGMGAGAFSGCGHKHTFSSEWETNTEYHWHAATCEHGDEKGSYGKHEDKTGENGTGAPDGKCDVCGYTMTPGSVAVTGVTLDQNTVSVAVDSTVTLHADVSPADATDKTVTWTSESPNIATVTGGVVKGIAPGTAIIKAQAGTFTATCTVTVTAKPIPVEGITLDKEEATVEVDDMVLLKAKVTPVNATDKTVKWTSSDDTKATVTDGKVVGVSEGDVTITATAGSFSAQCTVTVTAATPANINEIKTAKDLIAFRNTENLEAGTYKLAADIDLEGRELEAPKAVIGDGVIFDGQGHTISNAVYNDAGSKDGLLFKTINGGEVKDIKFLACSINSSAESAGILAGECNASSTISKIEFNSCSATTTSNYVGLLFARTEESEAAVINISEITAKNGCTTSCAQYGGLLVGDLKGATTTVNFKELDIDGEFKGSSGNGSFIAGRTRAGSSVSVENAVISAQMPVANSIGIFSGNGKCAKLTIKNVLIVKSNVKDLYQSNQAPEAANKTIENLVTVAGVTVNESTAQNGEKTAAYLKDTLGFNFTADTGIWMEEGTDGFRLRAASTNVKSPEATIKSLKVSASNVKTRFKKGETFSSEGLSVMGVYSDGVQIALKPDEGYTVDYSGVNLSQQGSYIVTVVSVEDKDVVGQYEVTVAEETGFKVYGEFVPKVYLVNDAVDYSNLVVVSTWSDGVEERLQSSDYKLNSNGAPDMAAAGVKSIRVDYGTYEGVTIDITVIAEKAAVVDNTVNIKVDSAATANGAKVGGVETFKTVADAIDFLEACKYDKEVVKVVNVAAGTYKAKITTDLCNLTLIGANTDKDDDKSILTYSAVESTVDIVGNKPYGLDCATLKVSGENFTAKNITIRNDFDYIHDNMKESSPQGLALTIDGDKAELNAVHLYGNQDTLYLKNGRAYFKNSLIEGNIDFIFGEAKGIAFFDTCEIRAITKSESKESNNGYVTAMKADATNKPDYGYVFYKCALTDDGKLADGSMSLGRPWGAKATVAYIECSFTKAYSTVAYGTTNEKNQLVKSRWFDMSGNSPVGADFAEYKSTGEGAIQEAVAGGKILTDGEAEKYTIANVFAMENGNCKWTTPWAGTNEKVSITIKNGEEEVIYSGAVEKGVSITEDMVKGWLTTSKKSLTGLYTNKECDAAYSYDNVINEALVLYATYSEVNSTTYTYTYVSGTYTAEAPWSSTCVTESKSLDSTPVAGLKIEKDDNKGVNTNLTLTATGKKATVDITGFTTGSGNPSQYLTLEFYDAAGEKIGELKGTTTSGKLNGKFTFEKNGVFEADAGKQFASIKFTTSKNCAIVSATITVE